MSEPIVWNIDNDARRSYEHERFYVATVDGVTVRDTYACGDWWVMACDSGGEKSGQRVTLDYNPGPTKETSAAARDLAARAVVAAVKVLRGER